MAAKMQITEQVQWPISCIVFWWLPSVGSFPTWQRDKCHASKIDWEVVYFCHSIKNDFHLINNSNFGWFWLVILSSWPKCHVYGKIQNDRSTECKIHACANVLVSQICSCGKVAWKQLDKLKNCFVLVSCLSMYVWQKWKKQISWFL